MKTQKQRKGLGYLYKRDSEGKEVPATSKKRGTFWLAYRDEDGKRIRVRVEKDGQPVTDLETAKKEQLRMRAPYMTGQQLEVLKENVRKLEARQEVEQDQAEPPLAIADAWKAYEDATNRPECGDDTLSAYRTTWRRLVEWLKEEHPEAVYLRDITDEIANAHMAALRKNEWTANTYNKQLAFLRLLFRVLAKPARITENPFNEITRRKLIVNSRRELTIEELRRVIVRADGEMKTLFEIGTFTGLRLGDCCTLRWCEVDLMRGIIKRKPRKTLHSSGAEVTIGIPGVLFRVLDAIPEADRGEYVLPGYAARYLGGKTKQTYISQEIQRHFENCGIRTHLDGTGSKHHYEGKKKVYDKTKRAVILVGFHSLRHTYASLHAASGTPQALIQENMGHSNPAMTEHYQHVSEETARRAAAALDIPRITDEISADAPDMEVLRGRLLRVVENADGDLLQRLLRTAGIEPVKRLP